MSARGFSVIEFLISITSVFGGLYFIFWFCYLGTNYTLAQYYLHDYSFCELKSNPRECWQSLYRRVDSLKFVQIKKLSTEKTNSKKTAVLVFNYELPVFGLGHGVQNIQLSSTRDLGQWR